MDRGVRVSFHKTDPPRFGAGLKSLQQEISHVARVEAQRSPLIKKPAGGYSRLPSGFVKKVLETGAQLSRDAALHGFSAYDTSTGERIDPATMKAIPCEPYSVAGPRKSAGQATLDKIFLAWEEEGSKVEILPGKGEANSGPHPPAVHADEVELMGHDAFEDAKKSGSGGLLPKYEDFGPVGAGEISSPQVEFLSDHDSTYTLTILGRTSDPIPFGASIEEAQEIAGKVGIEILSLSPAMIQAFEAPSEDLWSDVVFEAKARKKGIAKIAPRHGLKLVSDDADPKNRTSWKVSS